MESVHVHIYSEKVTSLLGTSIKNRNPKSDALAKTHFSLIVSIYTYITTLNLISLCKRKNSKRERTWEKLQCIWRRKKGKKMESCTIQKKKKKKREKLLFIQRKNEGSFSLWESSRKLTPDLNKSNEGKKERATVRGFSLMSAGDSVADIRVSGT